MLGMELMNLLLGERPTTTRAALTLDLQTFELRRESIPATPTAAHASI